MTEDQYYPSYLDEETSNSTVNTGCDFNKYDPYVEKIRTLFVPSLEPRIHSCLETFVYREDREALSEPPYLKRCLDVAATWREPVHAFSSKFGEPRFLEKMLTRAAKYLIKDGLIDCFLNSIILNNRLNKVCRNLDAAGIQKDFLRHLAVWNYVNEKNYWMENDSTASTFMLSPSYDSIDTHSDLEVQIGSGPDNERRRRRCKQASKRPVVDSSECVCSNVNDFPENCSSPKFGSDLNIDFRNPEESKSSWVKRKPRPISKTHPCRPSNCPSYRAKSFQQLNWEGKSLKLRVCKIPSNCPANFDRGHAEPCRLSRLPLPCKFDDMIADVFKADRSVPRLSSITTSKKLRASVTDICRCLNETLGKMSREEVKRCRFHCEILPELVTFKLVRREANGCKACLFSDRIATDKIDGHFAPRGISFSQKFENIEEESTEKMDLPISESTRVDLADKDSHPVSSRPTEAKSETEPRFTNSIRNLSRRELDDTNNQKSNEFVGNESSNKLREDQFQGCTSSFLNGFENSEHEEEGNTGSNRVEGSQRPAGRNDSVESPEQEAMVQSSGNAIEDGSCYCNNSDDDKLEIFNPRAEKSQDADCVDSIEVTETKNLGKRMTPSSQSSGNEAEDQTCHCSDSFPYTIPIDHGSDKHEESNSVERLEAHVKDLEASNREESCRDVRSVVPDYQKMSETNTGKTGPVMDSEENVQPVLRDQLRLGNTSSEVTSRNGPPCTIKLDGIRSCECPASCECINKRNDEHEVGQCDSQCSCDICGTPENSTPLNPVTEDTRISLSVKPEQSSKLDTSIRKIVRPIVTDKSQYLDVAGSVQLQPNYVESAINSEDPRHPNTRFLDTEVENTFSYRTNYKSEQISFERPSGSVIKETTRRLPRLKAPAPLDTSRACYDDQHDLGECASQCSCDTCGPPETSTSLNRDSRNVTRISTSANSERPSKADSLVPNLARPGVRKDRQCFDTASAEMQPNCSEPENHSRHSCHPKNDQEPGETWRTRTSFKSVQIVTKKLPSSVIKETNKASSPLRIQTGRASSSRSQRINISIELCSESLSSGDKSLNKEPKTVLPVGSNGSIRSGVQYLPPTWRPGCHSGDVRISRKQAILKSEKNTKDKCLRHLRGTNACLHSPPRPLESRDYLPPSQPPSRMVNPIVYGMSTKSEGQSTRQHKRRKNRLNYSENNENGRGCKAFQKNGHSDKPNEPLKLFSSATKNPKDLSSSVLHHNLCHAFSAGSVDRMKHLIKTKLRRILLERDKATNTPKISFANEKYRVSVPYGKAKRLPFPRQRCHTIWESRSASASTHTSRTLGSNGRSLAEVSEGDEIKTLFHSTTISKFVAPDHKDLETCSNSDRPTCYRLRTSDQSVVSSRIIDQRLVGGSDDPCQKGIDREFQYLWKQRQENVQNLTNKEVQYVCNHCDHKFGSKSTNRSCTGDSVAGNVSSKLSHLWNGADYEEEVTLDERQDEITKCPGKLDCSGNSTSRHIYLHEYDNIESSNDGEAKKWCEPKISSPKCNSLPICKRRRREREPRSPKKAHKSNGRPVNCRSSRRQSTGEPKMARNIRASSFASSKVHATGNIKIQEAFGKLDQDLRSKLLQYVSLCRNVKYSLLKMLRPDDVYDVRRPLSIPREKRYRFADS